MEVVVEKRKLQMHRKLLLDTINRQAGSLEKAVLEGVMNSIEAESPEVIIGFTEEDGIAKLSIHDSGIGIETKDDLIAHFETFGTPHEESENTHWKQFRMGRGQMFSFGINVWRTATFKMTVDIADGGGDLSYILEENLPYVQGCQINIDLYKNPFGYSYNSMESFAERLKEHIKFMEVPVMFNGEQLNTPASHCKWDFEDENAYYLFNMGADFKVYNLGAFTMREDLSDMGMHGIVVSKQQVKVNFARNDIQHDCPIYNQIKAVVKKNRIIKTRKAQTRLSSCERQATLKDLRDGEQDYDDVKSLALIPTAQGKHISLAKIRNSKQQWSFAPTGDRLADNLMEMDLALCFSDSVLDDLDYMGDRKEFFLWLTHSKEHESWNGSKSLWGEFTSLYTTFDCLSDGKQKTFEQIVDKKYTVSERRIVKILQEMNCWDGRRILLGYSDVASGWTDGNSYICIERNWLKRKHLSYSGEITKIIMLLVHELAHNDDTRHTHTHGPEFYEAQVEICNRSNSPINFCSNFRYRIEQSRITEKRAKEDAKLKKLKDAENKKLGLNQNTIIPTQTF